MRVDGLNCPFVALIFEERSFLAFDFLTFEKKKSFRLFEFFEKIDIAKFMLEISNRLIDEEGLGIFKFVGFEFDGVLYDF